MGKQEEIAYLNNLNQTERERTVKKPFNHQIARNLSRLGDIFYLLPPPPARLLDLGCGTGWTSLYFAQAGYQVVGLDISPDMINEANKKKFTNQLDNLEFLIGDYELINYHQVFDIVVFFDSLHHADDPEQALFKVYQALKIGGICITSEPALGHTKNPETLKVMEKYGVEDKDIPPSEIVKLARSVGFLRSKIYPLSEVTTILTKLDLRNRSKFYKLVLKNNFLYNLAVIFYIILYLLIFKRNNGMVKIFK